MATLLTTPSVVYPPQDQFTQAQLVAMGAKGASPDSQIQTQAVSIANPGKVVGGAYGVDQNGVKTQYQAYTSAPAPQPAPVAQVTNQPTQTQPRTSTGVPSNVTSNTSYIDSSPTAGDIYNGVVPTVDKTLQDAYDAQGNLIKDRMKPVDETAIRNETMKRFQSEIDAIQQYYADLKQQKLNEQAPINEGRLGSNAAIEARRGMIGSDFGNAQTSGIEKMNQQANNSIISSVGAEMNAAVQAVLGKARDAAQAEIDAKKAAKEKSPQDYIDFLKGAADRKDQRVTGAVNNLIALGQKPDDTSLKSIADQLGIDPEQFKAKYLAAKATSDAEKAKNAPKPMEVSAGASLYDPTTGKFLGTAPNRPTDNKPVIEKFADDTTRQWNPTTQTWDILASANTTLDSTKLLTPTEAAALGLPYGTTRGEAAGKGIVNSLPPQVASRVDRLVGQYDNEPIVKEFNVIQNAKEAVKAYQQNPQSTNDQALIYAFAKAMDPTSSVREGEYSTVQKYAQSFAQQLGFDIQRLYANDPQFLSPDARQRIVNTINSKYNVTQQQYNNLSNEYGRRVNQITGGTNGMDYVTNYGGAFAGENTQTKPVAINDVENNAGMSLPPVTRQKVQDLISEYPNATLEQINAFLGIKSQPGFNKESQTSLNGQKSSVPNKVVDLKLGTKTVSVNPSIANNLASADAEFFAATGSHIQVNESFRSIDRQKQLYEAYRSGKGGRAAPPGKSFHQTGKAIDVANWEQAAPYLRKYGLKNSLPDDRNHFSIGEFS